MADNAGVYITVKDAGITKMVVHRHPFTLEQTEPAELVVQSPPADAQHGGGFHFGAAYRSQGHLDKFFFYLGESHTELDRSLGRISDAA